MADGAKGSSSVGDSSGSASEGDVLSRVQDQVVQVRPTAPRRAAPRRVRLVPDRRVAYR